jgi:hypothetical protein
MMEARTSLLSDVLDGALLLGVPSTLGVWLYVWCFQSPDILNIVPAMLTAYMVSIAAHAGVEFHSTLAFLGMNLLAVPGLFCGTLQRPYDHQVS